jgi:hypothetical protein
MAQVHMRIADRRSRRFVPLLAALGVALAGLATVLAAGASLAADEVDADLQEVTWFHSTPGDVRSFELFVAPQQEDVALAPPIPVGKQPSKKDSQSFSAFVDMDEGEYIAVRAIGKNGIQSALSNLLQRPPGPPGPPYLKTD